MTPQQAYITSLVIDTGFVQKLARESRRRSLFSIKSLLVNRLVDHYVVHAELNLTHTWSDFPQEDLEKSLKQAGIAFQNTGDSLAITLKNYSINAIVCRDGGTVLIAGRGIMTLVNLVPESVAKLLFFVDEVLPELELKVATQKLDNKKEETAADILATSVKARLEQKGRPIRILPEGNRLRIWTVIKPSQKLSVILPFEKVDDFVTHFDEIVNSAELLYNYIGNPDIYELEPWDRWAYPYCMNDK